MHSIINFNIMHVICIQADLASDTRRGGLDTQYIAAVIVAFTLSVMLLVAVAFLVWCIVARVRHSRKIPKFPTGTLPPDNIIRRCVCLIR